MRSEIDDETGRGLEGGDLEPGAESVCAHGDAPNAAEIVQAVRAGFAGAGIAVVPLAVLALDRASARGEGWR